MSLPTFRVWLGFPTNPSDRLFILDLSLLDGGDVLAPDGGGFVDVTDRLDGDVDEPIHTVRGAPSPLTDYATGRATVRFRNNGDLDPLNLDGEYVLSGETLVRVRRRLMVTAELADGSVEERFHGYVDSFDPDFDSRGWPIMVVEASGVFARLSTLDPAATTPVGAGEDSGARIDRVLDNAEVPDGERDIAVGDSTLQATTLAQPPLTEARNAAASEMGAFYEDRSGHHHFDNRRARLTEARQATPQATFGPPGYPDSFPYQRLVPKLDDKRLRNDASIARVGGATQTAEDAESITRYWRSRDRRTDLVLETDSDVADWAAWRVLLYGDVEYRYESVLIDVQACPDDTQDDLVAYLIRSELRDRLEVVEQITYYPDDDPAAPLVRENTAEVFVERVEEWIGPWSWRVAFGLSDAEPFTDLFTLDVSLLDGGDRLAPF